MSRATCVAVFPVPSPPPFFPRGGGFFMLALKSRRKSLDMIYQDFNGNAVISDLSAH